MPAGVQYYVIFCFYIGVFLFVVMNSLTSLFVDSVMCYAENNEGERMRDRIRKKHRFMTKLSSLFKEMDVDGSGQVSLSEFSNHLADPRMEAFSESMEME